MIPSCPHPMVGGPLCSGQGIGLVAKHPMQARTPNSVPQVPGRKGPASLDCTALDATKKRNQGHPRGTPPIHVPKSLPDDHPQTSPTPPGPGRLSTHTPLSKRSQPKGIRCYLPMDMAQCPLLALPPVGPGPFLRRSPSRAQVTIPAHWLIL